MQPAPLEERLSAVRNAAWHVRWYCRPHQEAERAQAITTLAAAIRAASIGEDLSPIVEGIRCVLL